MAASSLTTKAHSLLSKGDVSEAVFVANCVEEILKIPTLSKQELDILSLLYLKILDRLFGEETTSPPDSSGSASSSAAAAVSTWAKGNLGGWLRALVQSSSSFGGVDNLPHPGAKLLRHFLPNCPLFGLLGEISYELRIPLLPPKLQMLLTSHYLYGVFAVPCHSRILQLLRHPAVVSKDVSSQVPLKVDATEYFLFCMARYPTLFHFLSSISTSPAALPTFGGSSSLQAFGPASTVLRTLGVYAWTGSYPYLAVLWAYLREFFPNVVATASSSAGQANGLLGSNRLPESLAVHSRESRYKELFVRLATEYWLNTANVVHYDFDKVAVYRQQLYASSASYFLAGQYALSPDHPPRAHPPPHEALLLNGNVSVTFTLASCQSAYLLLFGVLSDPRLLEDLSSGKEWTSPETNASIWLRTLQAPLFDMIRCVFQKGEQNAVDRELVRLVCQVWLLALQPWAINTGTGRLDHTRKYTTIWKPYLAVSFHFYTTLVNSFLRMLVQLNDCEDVSTLATLEDVLCVFCVDVQADLNGLYRNYLSTHGTGAKRNARGQPLHFINEEEIRTVSEMELQAMDEHHQRLFPDRSIYDLPNCGLSLPGEASLDQLATVYSVLERIVTTAALLRQHEEGLLAQVFHRVEEWFGVHNTPESGPTALAATKCQRLLVEWCPSLESYLLSSQVRPERAGMTAQTANGDGLRDVYTSLLTEKGQEALRAGTIRCQSKDVTLRRDSLEMPLCSYEHPAVARLCIAMSKWVNTKLSLPKRPESVSLSWQELIRLHEQDHGSSFSGRWKLLREAMRCNLRWVAQYRVVGVLLLVLAGLLINRLSTLSLLIALYAIRLVCAGSFPVRVSDL